MTQLTKHAYDNAVVYLKTEARPLEKALFAYHFEGGSASDVLEALAAHQNADGGFGHGLEADIRLPASSVIATTVAFQHFRELATPADHPMVVNACRYLRDNYDTQRRKWPIIPPNIDDAPHAPWWELGGGLDDSPANPRAEIAGYVWDYAAHFPTEFRDRVTQDVVDYLFEQPDTMPMHDLLCYLRFWETPNLPAELQARLLPKLKAIANAIIDRDPASWRNYGLPPLLICSVPDSPFAEGLDHEIALNLDYVIGNQGENGAWTPNWSWGDMWPDEWQIAQREWSGRITLNNLLVLHRFGRIEA